MENVVVCEVVLGGERRRRVRVGGVCAPPPFHIYPKYRLNPPAVAMDVFDPPRLPRPVKMFYGDVVLDVAEWAKVCVKKYGADLVALHLIGTHPQLGGKSPGEAARTVEEVLQAVDAPLIIGGSGDKSRDPEVLAAAAEVADGEGCLLNSASLEMNYELVVEAAKKHGHAVVSWVPLSLPLQRKLNRELLRLGLPIDRIVMDPTTAPLGYGLHYSLDIVERIRREAFNGDAVLRAPILSGSSNAWGAREARLDKPGWGPLELRGPLWEAVNALAMFMAGADVLLMMHPKAVGLFRRMVKQLMSSGKTEVDASDISGVG